jgi:hypothetical protein
MPTRCINFASFFFLYPTVFNLKEVAAVDIPKVHLWETGIMRITRHPQFVGQSMWSAAHLMMVLHTHTHTHTHANTHAHTHNYMHTHTHTHTHTHIMCVYYIYICVCVCIHIYAPTHI